MADLILNIDGMTCGGCVKSVSGVLTGMAGVSEAQVSLEGKQADIQYDPAIVSPEELAAAVADAGFDVSY
ncbi:heavy-metal-associated domain-containing protein [Chromobacterium sp. IIBBL 290-4]|uniref:heavy-metal-associated domain-containing protein n=1 Tax=Chromobacterium sp. IIBBL 290-4 TaxID=2953890 RepID=UPI0020B6FD58|nr:heavy metal-associated domain-containing protein [Chromobacterium sp. IIBBL 290-4]UTH74825.1 heavy-metal-associated domain-containing protein [Chromobacterium sp. IIBBL 290-4]